MLLYSIGIGTEDTITKNKSLLRDRLIRLIKLIAVIVGFFTAFYYIISPLKARFGIICPGCGSTRAMVAFFRGNIGEAFYWHPLFPLYIIGFVIFAFATTRYVYQNRKNAFDLDLGDVNAILKGLFEKKIMIALLIVFIVLFFSIYIIRLLGIVDPTILASLR